MENKWISPEDELPEEGERVLCVWGDEFKAIDILNRYLFWDDEETVPIWKTDEGAAIGNENITCWMPLPDIIKK